jgi:hypothetical protein
MSKPRPETATAHQLAMLRLEAGNAARAVAMQSARATGPSEHDESFDGWGFRSAVDFRFLTVALRWLEDIAEHANRTLADHELSGAIQAFRDAMPEARNMRNIGEHLPEYLLGAGRLQQQADLLAQRGQTNQLGVMIWTGHAEHGTQLTWAGTNIDANEARRAADHLYLAVRDAIDRFAPTDLARRPPAAGATTTAAALVHRRGRALR